MIAVADPIGGTVWGRNPIVPSLTTNPPEHVVTGARRTACRSEPRVGRWAVAILAGALAPALAAIWAVPWFVPQDSPAHVYNAQILVWSFDPASPFRDVYTVNWQPIPNWAGPLTLAGLVAILPAWVADRIMTSLTLVCFAAAVFWLRWRVAGTRGLHVAGSAGHAPRHEHGLAVRLCQLHAGGLPVPDHARDLVAGPRPFERRLVWRRSPSC